MGVFRPKAPSRGLWVPWAGSLWHKRAGVATSWSQTWSRITAVLHSELYSPAAVHAIIWYSTAEQSVDPQLLLLRRLCFYISGLRKSLDHEHWSLWMYLYLPISRIGASCLVFIILQISKLFSSDTQCSLLTNNSKVCSAKSSHKKSASQWISNSRIYCQTC